ncbi:unnamed protein product [Choristocarpus tenellus]
MTRKGKNTMAKNLRYEIMEMWEPLLEIQAEDQAEKRALEMEAKELENSRLESEYAKWRGHIAASRDEAKPIFTPRGNSIDISISGVTTRAGDMGTPRAANAAVLLAGGSNHVLMIHRSGHLYTWGMGVSGRLGLDLYQAGNPQASKMTTVIQAFNGRPVTTASAGYSHSAAVTASGHLYTWGSAATGKVR